MTTIDRALLKASWRSWLSDEGPRIGPRWLLWTWTLLFAAVLAVGFTILGYLLSRRGGADFSSVASWAGWYGRNLIVCVVVAGLIHLMFDLSSGWMLARKPRWAGWQRSLYFGGVPMLGVLIGWPIGATLAGVDLSAWLLAPGGLRMIAGSLLISTVISFFLHHWFASKAREQQAEQRATEAQLRLLQGQIEPHFLFNTLANVQSLIDADPAKAKHMLESFTDYLRATLSGLRRGDGTLGGELELAEAYLRLLQSRMEERLQFSIDAPAELRALPLPPLLLQPLVENAIVHGLEPQVRGGTVRITARRDADQLVLEVHDDGRGPDAPPRRGAQAGAGVALVNIRERLRGRYGPQASLEITAADPGTRATLRLPASDH